MSKERARRRAEREAEAERLRATRAAALARRQRRQALRRRLVPKLPKRRTGRLFARRSRVERAGIAVVAGGALLLIWMLVESVAVRIGLTALLVLVMPAMIVLTLDRRT